jgi:hypothetical protein
MRPEDGPAQLLQRLAELVAFAKQDGGNHTCTDNGLDVDVVPPSREDQPARRVTIA